MDKPFKILPSEGYKNSQFQVLSKNDSINIELYYEGKLEKTIPSSKDKISIIHKLDKAGTYTAKCDKNGEIYEQDIIVKDALRLGSSQFKKAFVFDDSPYSFFLMKDRLLIYDENKNVLLTENNLSPTEILQIDSTTYLFKTQRDSRHKRNVNLAVYSTNSFTILGELVDKHREIQISISTNKVWLYEKSSESIHCFEILNNGGEVFKELITFENAKDYKLSSKANRISINKENRITFVDITNVFESIVIAKTPNNAIDEIGTNLSLDQNKLKLSNKIDGYEVCTNFSGDLNLDTSQYLYVGDNLKQSQSLKSYSDSVENIKNKLMDSLPENDEEHYHSLPDSDVEQDSIVSHYIYPTIQGIFIITKETKKELIGVKFRKTSNKWYSYSEIELTHTYSMVYANNKVNQTKIESTDSDSYKYLDYFDRCLFIEVNNKKQIYRGKQVTSYSSESEFNFYTAGDGHYVSVKEDNTYSWFDTSNLHSPILDQVKIHNHRYIKHHSVVWYSEPEREKDTNKQRRVCAYDLSSDSFISFDQNRTRYLMSKDISNYNFEKGYIQDSNEIIINPQTTAIKDSVVGTIESYSSDFNKIVTSRSDHIYLFIYNNSSNKYEEKDGIELGTNNIQESYLSPDGKFLVLKEHGEYSVFDIKKNEKIRFFTGNFLKFSKEGNLIIEKDNKRSAKVYDAVTLSEIKPSNYHHYKFLSPDGKLYAPLSPSERYINKLNGEELAKKEVRKLRDKLGKPYKIPSYNQKDKQKINEFRKSYYKKYERKFKNLGTYHYSDINTYDFIKIKEFIEIGIVGTDKTTEINLAEGLGFYNYAAFSYDNKYFGYVGKPSRWGLIHLFKLDFDATNKTLSIVDDYLTKLPKMATWVCGFSKTDYFAAYDSRPYTYLIKMDEQLFEDDPIEFYYLRDHLNNERSNIYNTYKRWTKIRGKNFLCFSPTGEYIALSEQGYDPYTLGGYGHQESNAVHIAVTETGKVVNSFREHGDNIKYDDYKKITFVGFSEDERRIMTLSKDGVVIIRDLDI